MISKSKFNDIPEVRQAKARMADAYLELNRIDDLNCNYFMDKPYHLSLSSGFVEGCEYTINLSTKEEGFSFPILNGRLEDVQANLEKIDEMLSEKKLWKFMYDKIKSRINIGDAGIATLENFCYVTLKMKG